MALTLREATPEDAATLVEIYFSAFSGDAISLLVFPRNNDSVYKFWYDMILSEMKDPCAHYLVVTTPLPAAPSQEHIIAWCKWNAPSSIPLSPELPPSWPEGSDTKIANLFFSHLFTTQIRIMGAERKHWYLELLATRPEYQGRGAGGMLLRWGIERADEKGERMFLDASPKGRPIYEHFGFKEVEKLVVDLEGRDPCGDGEEEFVEVMMLRDGKA